MEIIKKAKLNPDWHNVQMAARNQWAPRLPLYEHNIGAKAIEETTGYKPYDLMYSKNVNESIEGFRQYWDFWRQMGYDTAQMEICMSSILPGNGALGGHEEGCIKTREDFNNYPWAEIPDMFFSEYEQCFINFSNTCPEGMKAVGGIGNGVFEAVQDIVGYTNLCYIKADDEELYADIFKAMGDVQYKIWNRFLSNEYSDVFCVLRFGDDLGFNTQTLISTEDIRQHVIPCYKAITGRVHKENKPFLLHSCGNLFSVMDDIISEAGIDAKHSNEDGIAHFSVWVDKYGDRIGNFGGIDTDVLCRYDRAYIHKYILECLEKVEGKGGIAFSSGNSIPDYVPVEGYLAMIETVREWRGDFK